MDNKKISEVLYCAGQRTRCYDACLIDKEKDKLEKCMALDQDCAEICRLTGQLIERKSENVDLFMKLCEKMCHLCASECEKHDHMEHCKRCAEICKQCAEKMMLTIQS